MAKKLKKIEKRLAALESNFTYHLMHDHDFQPAVDEKGKDVLVSIEDAKEASSNG